MQKNRYVILIGSCWRKVCLWLLAFCWIVGLVVGAYVAQSEAETVIDLVRRSVQCEMTISGVMSVCVLPFLLSAFAVLICEPWLLLFISTLKAFRFSFCAWGVCLAFGQSSWLVLFLFLFSDICLIPLLVFFWIRNIRGHANLRLFEIVGFLIAAVSVGLVDYLFISPFLASLMK